MKRLAIIPLVLALPFALYLSAPQTEAQGTPTPAPTVTPTPGPVAPVPMLTDPLGAFDSDVLAALAQLVYMHQQENPHLSATPLWNVTNNRGTGRLASIHIGDRNGWIHLESSGISEELQGAVFPLLLSDLGPAILYKAHELAVLIEMADAAAGMQGGGQ